VSERRDSGDMEVDIRQVSQVAFIHILSALLVLFLLDTAVGVVDLSFDSLIVCSSERFESV
jgi:hypothetical protein